jgi:hypothetical protein
MDKEKLYMVGGVVLVCVLAFGGIMFFSPKAPDYAGASTHDLALICTTDMATQFHIHPMLKIIEDGKNIPIPADIGITNDCLHPLHTHDATGELHVESPVKRDFTLGDFFTVWNQPFSSTTLMDKVVDAEHPLTMTVNGEATTTFENLVLHDADQIIITYGK